MAYTRRNTSLDIQMNRAWTADAVADLANIPARHGDQAYVSSVSRVYLYFDTIGWLNVSSLVALDISGYATGRIPFVSSGALGYTSAGGTRDVFCGQNGLGFPYFDDVPPVNGIGFPATQVPDADPNTLDDYEEGTWTPVLNFGGATTGITYSLQTGVYTKIGNRVLIDFYIKLSSKGSATGTATITGLPFTQGAGYNGFAGAGYYQSMAALTSPPFGAISSGATTMTLFDGAATAATVLDDTNFGNTSWLNMNAAYFS